ncbi:hypothetical protein C4B60_03625 [Jeotgalibacillus proteolyticus]|uniref:Uncharacterized protein n=1 Tax=Jeotgalibacillus proteolyticus TaxID=2082395 RepID=A0A2S5GDT4_9BACL|nr:hypothetical protein C4B60_03625 [Jeotgalibacillus proteolyticus]
MSILLLFQLIISGISTWISVQLMYFIIEIGRSDASSSFPGDLTLTEEWMHLLIPSIVLLGVQLIVAYVLTTLFKESSMNKYSYGIATLSVSVFFYLIYSYLFI